LANQWMRPQVYSLWENLQESLPVDDTTLMPKWMREQEPMSLSRFGRPDIILRPDMPHQRLVKTIESLTSVRGLAGQSYPLYKLPLESIANKQFALDKALAEALGFFGAEGAAPLVRTADGQERMITDYPSYALGNAFPLLAQLQRISGGRLGGKESYADRQNAAIASYFGLPLDFVTERMKGSELIGRKFNLNDYTALLVKLGLIPSAEIFNRQQGMPARIQRRKNIERRAESRAQKAADKKESEANQKASDNAKLQLAADKYGTDSDEYKAVKKEIADRKKAEKDAKAKAKQQPIQVAGDEDDE